jgi:hypothetical protein
VLDDVQAAPIEKLRIDERWITVPAEVGDVNVGNRTTASDPIALGASANDVAAEAADVSLGIGPPSDEL